MVERARNLLALRKELYSLMAWHLHHNDLSPWDTLRRLIIKGTGIRIKKGKIKVKERYYKLDALEQFRTSSHENSDPYRIDAPLIIFNQGNTWCLLDGQKRINHWKDIGFDGPHRVLIVSIGGSE